MWRMLQADGPNDYVIGTGIPHSVRDVCRVAFEHLGLDWERHVEVDPNRFRPAEVDHLMADFSRARDQLGWEPTMEFDELVRMMVDADVRRLKGEVVTA
jgi:GDPmannose 4,6-dehydratase